MKLGIVLPQHDSGRVEVLDAARRAEHAGLDSIWAYDNLAPKPGFGRLLECWSVLSAAAAVTERITVGSLVLRVTLRPPAVGALMASSLEALAPGRVVMGLGTGDASTREEMRRAGLEWPDFSARLKILTTQTEHIRRSSPGTPVWIGGAGPRILSLVPQVDGWSYWGSVEGYEQAAGELDAVPGTRRAVRCWGGLGIDGEGLVRLAGLGVDHAVVAVGAARYAERIDWLASMRAELP